MIELPDDELDKLFRKSSEELDPRFDPEDWNNLKKRLDQQDGRTLGAWFRKWWPLGLLLLMIPGGIASYYIFGNAGKNKEKGRMETVSGLNSSKPANEVAQSQAQADNKVSAEKEKAADSEEQKSSGLIAKDSKVEDLRNNPSAPGTKDPEKKTTIEKITDKDNRTPGSSSKSDFKTAYKRSRRLLPRSLSKAGGVYLEPNRSKGEGGDGALTFNADEKVHKNDPNGTNASELGARQAIGSNGVTKYQSTSESQVVNTSTVNPEISETESSRMVISAISLANRPLIWKNNIAYPGIIAVTPEPKSENATSEKTEKSESEKDGLVESPKWAVRVGYSPDLTSVGFKNFTKPGSAFSLLLDYGISKKLYLQAGVVRSVKDYYALASEYELSKYVTQINTPYGVDGICTMIEVPLGIRYDIAQKAHSRWFAGTGFSSYYVQKEKYKYHYKKYIYNQKPGWEDENTGWAFLSHLNASVGYERTITRKLSILAEPYIRIPLKGVGYGKVNLITTGMWLSLRYTPAFR